MVDFIIISATNKNNVTHYGCSSDKFTLYSFSHIKQYTNCILFIATLSTLFMLLLCMPIHLGPISELLSLNNLFNVTQAEFTNAHLMFFSIRMNGTEVPFSISRYSYIWSSNQGKLKWKSCRPCFEKNGLSLKIVLDKCLWEKTTWTYIWCCSSQYVWCSLWIVWWSDAWSKASNAHFYI